MTKYCEEDSIECATLTKIVKDGLIVKNNAILQIHKLLNDIIHKEENMDNDRTRDLMKNIDLKQPIHIIGCGATGSYLAHSIVRLGFTNLYLYDFDKVESHNLANQSYYINDINKYKTEALKEKLLQINNDDLDVHISNNAFTKEDAKKIQGVIFILTDTMSSRQEIVEGLRLNFNITLLIETRLSTYEATTYTVDWHNYNARKFYNETLKYTDEEAETSACGTKLMLPIQVERLVSDTLWNMINYFDNDIYYNELASKANEYQVYTNNWDIFEQ